MADFANIPEWARKLREPVNVVFEVLIPEGGGVGQCVPFLVPVGCTVQLRGTNGTAAGNTGPVHVATSADAALNGPNETLPVNYTTQFPVSNTAQIYVFGAAGDGVQVTVKG